MSKDYEKFMEDIFTCDICDKDKGAEKDYYIGNLNARIGMLMQNPGIGSKLNKEKLKDSKKQFKNYEKKFEFDTNSLNNWILSDIYYKFFETFFKLLKSKGLISFNKFDDYIKSGDLYNDVYFFDVVKCKKNTENVSKCNLTNCPNKFLYKEFNLFNKLEFIFVFGARTWDVFKKKFPKTELVDKDLKIKSKTVTQIHGYLYKSDIGGRELYVIPLVHMSPRIFNNLLRNSYFDYLEEGLAKYVEEKWN